MVGLLTLSSNFASCISTWTGYQAYDDEYYYSQPTQAGCTINVSVPAEMANATFNSVTLTYSASSGPGTRFVYYANSSTAVTNANLLTRLRNGQSLNLSFQFKAKGYSGGEGQHSEYCAWRNITITVDYTPAGDITGTTTVGNAGSAVYSIYRNSLAYGESMSLGITARPSVAINRVTTQIRPGSLGDGITYTSSKSISANNMASFTYTLEIPQSVYTLMTDRVYAAQIKISFTGTNGTTYTSGWVSAVDSSSQRAFKLLKSRAAPVISGVAWGENGTNHISLYGNLIAGKTVPTISFSITLDTTADTNIGCESRTVVIGGKTYTFGGNSGTLEALTEAGSNSYTISVTDSYGITGTYTGSITALSYTPPILRDVAISRYVSSLDSGGNTVYELNDDGNSLWFDAEISVQTTLGTGTNTWSLTITPTGRTAIAAVTDSSVASVQYEHDRTVITGSYSNLSTYEFTVQLTDAFTTLTQVISVPKAGGIFNIEATGVAVGMRSTGTREQPLFQVAYPTELASISKLNGRDYDTGWVSLSSYMDTSKVNIRDSYCEIRRIGKIVHVRFGVTSKSSINSSTWVNISSAIPEQFRPGKETFISSYSQTPGGYIGINASGIIRLRNQTGSQVSANWWVYCMGSYTVD